MGLVFLLAACGRVGFDPVGGDGGGTGTADGPGNGDGGGDGVVNLCPASYVHAYGTSRYRVENQVLQWHEAELLCESEGVGTHLIVIDDLAESIESTDISGFTMLWVGTSQRAAPGTWRYVTGGSAAFLGWAPGYPVGGGAQDCVMRQWFTDIEYRNDTCNMTWPSVCECDGVAADPAAF